MDNINQVCSDIWKELVAAARVEPALNLKPFYDEIVKKEDPVNNKVLIDFKSPTEMTSEEYVEFPAKSNWNANVKYSLYSINANSTEPRIRLCHFIMVIAYKLKIFGEDAFGKVLARCKIGAAVVNHALELNKVFFVSGGIRNRISVRVRPLNEETFKAVVQDILKCTNDTNLQRNYVGDGAGDVEIAGLGLPPSALTDGSTPSAEILFKRCLHEVKALVDSQAYLKNPGAPEIAAARIQSALLDGITRVTNGQSIPLSSRSTSPTMSTSSLGSNFAANANGDENNNNDDTGEKNRKKRVSPAYAMAEATLMSTRAALREADNFEAIIDLQREEIELRRESDKQKFMEQQLIHEERKCTTAALQRIVDKLCPELDPTEKFAARKRKLDDLRDVLGDDLYESKLQQLRNEFLQAAAL
jgi:hypothetical protein